MFNITFFLSSLFSLTLLDYTLNNRVKFNKTYTILNSIPNTKYLYFCLFSIGFDFDIHYIDILKYINDEEKKEKSLTFLEININKFNFKLVKNL